jgi:hypothetical protein
VSVPSIRSHDQGFVRAAPHEVFKRLDELSGYPGWWPGSEARDGGIVLPLAKRLPPATRDHRRENVGLLLRFKGDSLEWYLEPFDDGTIVNAFLDIRAAGSPARAGRRVLRMRRGLRGGLVGLRRAMSR